MSHNIEVMCACCQEVGIHGGRGLQASCYKRHMVAGTLDQYPLLRASLPRLWRLEEYTALRAHGVSVHEAALQLQVSVRTAERYEARLKAQAQAAA
ncbi:hypothetical protein ACIBKY_53430 [Nonomuraea sp. NPDC050394]|uniref:hypothetical protein n=1 Tax=Nonomuraea sp. NPDC050394 TaxID=3364363 RepID=UPI003798173A